MPASLDRFFRAGQLGPLILGMKPKDVQAALGDATSRSEKLNPLLLAYGPLELTFVGPKRQPPQLVQMRLSFLESVEGLPEAVTLERWPLSPELGPDTTLADFDHLLERIGIEPAVTYPGHEVHLHSGVKAVFRSGHLSELCLSRRDIDRNVAPILTDSREPSIRQIRDQLEEAQAVMNARALSAAFILAWAALEASMRRAALQAGLESQIGVQPSALMRALYNVGRLNSEDMALVEGARQTRTTIVHGLAPMPVDASLVGALIRIAERLLRSSETRVR